MIVAKENWSIKSFNFFIKIMIRFFFLFFVKSGMQRVLPSCITRNSRGLDIRLWNTWTAFGSNLGPMHPTR